MPPLDLLQAVRRRSFRAFRLYVNDGTIYDVRHPEMLLVAAESAVVGLASTGQLPPQIDRYEIVDLTHLVRLEPLAAPTIPADGQ